MMACNSAQLMLMLIGLVSAAKVVAVPLLQPLPSCPTSCGKLSSIPYPFGTSPDCYLDDDFLITCNHTFNPPKAFSRHGNMEVLDISLDGQMKVGSFVAYECYNSGRITDAKVQVVSQTFSVSSTRNKFYVVGCDTYALIEGYLTKNYTTGCAAVCDKLESVENGSCSGIGCCQNSIPRGERDFAFAVFSFANHSRVLDFNPCGYAFVAEEGYFNFSSADLMDLPNRTKTNNHVPVVLDWSVGNLTCQESMQNQSSYACRAKYSQCQDSSSGGYVCSCLPGFEGNPYLTDGCKDIDECETSHPCSRICTNSLGNYSCSCPKGFEGDGRREGTGCLHKDEDAKQQHIVIGTLLTLLLLLVGSFWIYRASKKRKLSKQREEFFQQNGGLLLQEKLSKQNVPIERAMVFSEKDLNGATNNFSEGTVIGKGGFGTVHKGVLSDGREVAIKKSKVTDPNQNEQFINEVVVLSQISHRHVVKLFGCCLETKVPYLVYEFIKNGTLHRHIHDEHLSSKFTWDLRLKVAAETGDALAYLHSAASIPIIHRDVKSTNILLDEDYNAKVADFGASKFIPLDKKEVTTLIQGTFGYLDPEYIHSSQLTNKSDVYSFGVVLAELVTGQPAVSFSKPESERNLAMHFVVSITEHKLLEILDHHLVVEGKVEQVKEMALLAKRCLNVKGEERPTMKEVAMQLEGMKRGQHHPWIENDLNLQESDSLPHPAASAGSQTGLVGDSKECNSTLAAYDSINKQIIESSNDGR